LGGDQVIAHKWPGTDVVYRYDKEKILGNTTALV
jgi:hypothetical protein